MSRVKVNTQRVGRAGELLVQFMLLREGIESSPLTTDAGIDLVAFSPRRRRAFTIQVKTNLRPKPAGGRGKPALDWWVRDDCPADFIACVDLSGTRVWLFRTSEFAHLAQQHSSGRRHLYMWCDPTVKRHLGRRVAVEDFERHVCPRRLRELLLVCATGKIGYKINRQHG